MSRDPATILQGLPMIGGRLSVAIDEIVRLITDDLPGVIAESNATKGTDVQGIAGIRIAPKDVDSVDLDDIVIDYSTEYRINGYNNYTGFTTLQIHSIDERIVQGRHVQNVSDRADLIAATLLDCIAEWADPNGLRLWTALTLQARNPLPGEWSKFNGGTLTYKLVQDMNDGWA